MFNQQDESIKVELFKICTNISNEDIHRQVISRLISTVIINSFNNFYLKIDITAHQINYHSICFEVKGFFLIDTRTFLHESFK